MSSFAGCLTQHEQYLRRTGLTLEFESVMYDGRMFNFAHLEMRHGLEVARQVSYKLHLLHQLCHFGDQDLDMSCLYKL